MDFLKNGRLFDCTYGGKPFSELTYNITKKENRNYPASVPQEFHIIERQIYEVI